MHGDDGMVFQEAPSVFNDVKGRGRPQLSRWRDGLCPSNADISPKTEPGSEVDASGTSPLEDLDFALD